MINFFIRRLKCKRGISLVEMVIALGIGAGVTVAVISITDMQMKSKNMIETGLSINDHLIQLKNSIRDPSVCVHNFGGLRLNKEKSNSLTEITHANGRLIAQVNSNREVKIDSININHLESLSHVNQELYGLVLSYRVSKSRVVNKQIKVMLRENPDQEVVGCGVSVSVDVDLARRLNCEDLGGSYTSGNCQLNGIKIGTREVCDVSSQGVLRLDSSASCPEVCDNTNTWRSICGSTDTAVVVTGPSCASCSYKVPTNICKTEITTEWRSQRPYTVQINDYDFVTNPNYHTCTGVIHNTRTHSAFNRRTSTVSEADALNFPPTPQFTTTCQVDMGTALQFIAGSGSWSGPGVITSTKTRCVEYETTTVFGPNCGECGEL